VLKLLTKWEQGCDKYLIGHVREFKNAYRILILKPKKEGATRYRETFVTSIMRVS